jgi:hypothetical protein
MVLASGPIVVKLGSYLPISLLNICLDDERMLEKLRPSEPLIWGFIEKTLEERFELWRHVLWEFNRVLHDQMNQSVDTVCVERRSPLEKLVNDHTKGPQINGVVVWELLDEFWRHIERRSFDGSQHDCVCRHGSCEPKIAELDNTVGRDQDILGLHISMDDPMRVKIV